MEKETKQEPAIPWIIKRFKERKITKKKREIEELKLDIEKTKLEKELEETKLGKIEDKLKE